MPGYFIAFEGGEGAGKSTQEALLAQRLEARGLSVTRTREPGGTPAAELMRTIVLDPKNVGLDDRAEALLFAASRADHAARVIRPALERGDVVICDRYLDSSVAYQGVGRDLGEREVRDLSLWATRDLLPDLTIVLDIDPAIGLARLTNPDRLEAEPLEYHRAVRAAFVAFAHADPARYLLIDATLPIEQIADAIESRVVSAIDASSTGTSA